MKDELNEEVCVDTVRWEMVVQFRGLTCFLMLSCNAKSCALMPRSTRALLIVALSPYTTFSCTGNTRRRYLVIFGGVNVRNIERSDLFVAFFYFSALLLSSYLRVLVLP
ncbi:unnamed protein product, partial [Ectocarpus sp. 13 AM-2016]